MKAGLIEEAPTVAFLEEVSRTVLQKSMENVYACGGKHFYNLYLSGLDGIRGKREMDDFSHLLRDMRKMDLI